MIKMSSYINTLGMFLRQALSKEASKTHYLSALKKTQTYNGESQYIPN